MRKRFLPIVILSTFAFIFSGCNLFGHGYDPQVTGIFVDSDRTITSCEITDFDNSAFSSPRYEAADFKAYAEKTISAYNKQKGAEEVAYKDDAKESLPVYIEDITFNDTTGKILLVFQNYEYYISFFGNTESVPVRKLVVGSVSDGVDSGLTFEGMVDAEGNAAGVSDITQNSKYTLIKIQGDTEVQTAGEIVYRSAEITQVDEYTVTVSGDTTGYIIFK